MIGTLLLLGAGAVIGVIGGWMYLVLTWTRP